MRHRSLSAFRGIEDEVLFSEALVGRVRDDWEDVRPLVEWLSPVLAGTGERRRR